MKSRELQNEEYAKTVQFGNDTRDYLVLYGKILDCAEQFEKLITRDYGEEVALTIPIYQDYIGHFLDKVASCFCDLVTRNLIDYSKTEL